MFACVRARAMRKIKLSKLRAKLHKVFMQYYTYKMDHYMGAFYPPLSRYVNDELRHVKNQAIVLVHINFAQSSIINLLKYIQIKMLLRFFCIVAHPFE